MPPSGEATRMALLSAATRLFAAQGIDGPSIDAIVRAAGARNASAVNYHFGSRAGLLQAVLDHHVEPIDARRRALLEASANGSEPSLELLAELTIDPLIDHLDRPLGAEYLRIRAELLGRGSLDEQMNQAPLLVAAAGSRHQLPQPRRARYRRELVTSLVFGGLADFARRYPDATPKERSEYGDLLKRSMVVLSDL